RARLMEQREERVDVDGLEEILIEPLSANGSGDGLWLFRVAFKDCDGRCFITAGEALRLRQLDTRWVARALTNLATSRGLAWLRQAVSTGPGLQLHHVDAHDAWCRSQTEAHDGCADVP